VALLRADAASLRILLSRNRSKAHPVIQHATPPSLPDDIEDITAAEYLDATARAASNGPDKLVLRHIGDELKRFPATRARLAIEFLTMAKHSLDQKDDACYLIADGACFGNSIEPSRLPEFLGLLESIIHRSLLRPHTRTDSA